MIKKGSHIQVRVPIGRNARPAPGQCVGLVKEPGRPARLSSYPEPCSAHPVENKRTEICRRDHTTIDAQERKGEGGGGRARDGDGGDTKIEEVER